MFESSNPGFASRFDKKRIIFKAWTAEQAAQVIGAEVRKDNKTMTGEAESALLAKLNLITPLLSWNSARDVFENILPALYSPAGVLILA